MNLKIIRKNNCEWLGTTLGITMLALVLLADSAGAAPYAYITNFGSNTVSVIDTSTSVVTATVPVGNNPTGVAVNPAGTKVYVANSDNTVSVIDTTTNTVTATVIVGKSSYGVAVNPAGTRVYVANPGDRTVSVIDTATNTVTATVSIGSVGSYPYPMGVAVNPAGTRVYVTNNAIGTVSVIDTATNTVTATVSVGSSPKFIAVDPAGTKVYVANGANGTVSVIDTSTNTVTATVNVGSDPSGVAVNPGGTRVYVTNFYSDSVSVIDTATNAVATMNVGSPRGVAVNPAGTRVYVANSVGTVSAIDTATNVITATVNVGANPYAFGQFIGPEVIQTPTLSVTATPTTVMVGTATPVTFTVTSGGTAVSGANIALSGGASGSGTTDSSGNAVISVNATAAGTVTAIASKTGYTNGTATVTAKVTTNLAPTVTPTPTLTVTTTLTPTVTATPIPTVITTLTPTVPITPIGQNTFKVTLTSEPASVEPGQTSTITVTVTGSDGTGISGADVVLDSIPAGKFDPASGTTNPFGRFTSTFTAPAKGNATVEAIVKKEGFADNKGNLQLAVASEPQLPSSLYVILILIVILTLVILYLWIKGSLKLVPKQTSIPCDGKSTLPIKVQFVNTFGKPRTQKKDSEIEMETSSGTIHSVVIPSGKDFIEAILTSSTECGPVMITATSGKQKRTAQVNFVCNEAYLDVEISPATIPADGKSVATVIIRTKDDKGNYITSLNERTVNMTTSIGTITSLVTISPRSQAGIATLTSGQISGTAKVIASSPKGEGKALYGEGKAVFTELAKMYCHRDGTPIAVDALVCPTCNKNPLLDDTDTKQCRNPKCKTVIPQSANFCHKCGTAQQ